MENWLKRKLPGETSTNSHGGSVAESVALKGDKSAKQSKKTSSGTITTVPSTQPVSEMTTLRPNSTHLILPKRKIEIKGPSSNRILNISVASTETSNLPLSILSGRISSVTSRKGIDEQRVLPSRISLKSNRQEKQSSKMDLASAVEPLMRSDDSAAMLIVSNNNSSKFDALQKQNKKVQSPIKASMISTTKTAVDACDNPGEDIVEISKDISIATRGIVISATTDSDQNRAEGEAKVGNADNDDDIRNYTGYNFVHGTCGVTDMALSGSSDEDENENEDEDEDGLHDEDRNDNRDDTENENRNERKMNNSTHQFACCFQNQT